MDGQMNRQINRWVDEEQKNRQIEGFICKD